MKKRYWLYVMMLTFVVSCAGSKLVVPGGPGETLIWSSDSEGRPEWTIKEPDVDGDTMLFVGLSEKYATEKEGRDVALRSATDNVVKYLGTLAKDKYEKVATSFGLTSSVVDPTASSRQYQKQLAANLVKRVKPRKWYIEKWDTPTGTGWKVFVMAGVPLESINDSFKKTAKDNMLEAKRMAKKAADEVAKKQAENAAEFWEKMAGQGVVEK